MNDLFFTYWSLFREPLITAIVSGAVLGLLGVYVVTRRIVFVSAALSQVAALGITLGFFLVATFSMTGLLHDIIAPVLAVVLSMAAVGLLVWIGDRPTLGRDAILGIAFIIPTALVLLVGPFLGQELHEIEAVLHGSAVLVRKSDLYAILGAGILILATQIAGFRGFVFASLDPIVARTQGVPVRMLDTILFGSIALMTGLVTRALGALPTFGLTVLPAIGALGLKVGLKWVFIIASVAGGLSGGLGYVLAFLTDWSVGASQTLTAAAIALILRGIGLLRR